MFCNLIQYLLMRLFKINILLLFTLLFFLSSENIISLSVSVNVTTINTYSNYTFQLQRNYGVYSNFISNIPNITLGSYINIIFPTSTYTGLANGDYTCSSNTSSLTCSMSNNVLTVSDYYSTTSSLTQLYPQFTVNNILNPTISGSSGQFQYTIAHSNGTIIDQSPPSTDTTISYFNAIELTSAVFTSCQISTSAVVSSSGQFIITITPTNPIPVNGYLQLNFPTNWNNDILQSSLISSSISCTPNANVSSTINCSYSLISGTQITVNALSTNSISNSFSFNLGNILIPPTTLPTDLITISSYWSTNQQIDKCSTQITGVVEATIQTINFSSLNNKTVSSNFNAYLSFSLVTPMALTDVITITIPNDFNPPTSILYSTFLSATYTINNYTITLSGFTSNSPIITSNNKINITLINCTNPISIKTTQNIIVNITRSNLGVQTGTVTYQATAGILNFTLLSSLNTTNSSSGCYMTINTASLVSANSYIILQYPYTITPLIISNPTISLCVLNSTSVSGCQYSLNSTVLNFTNIFNSNFPTGTILLNFSQLTNPPSILPVIFNLYIYSSAGYLINSGTLTYTSTVSTITSPSIISSSTVVLYSPANLTLNFTTSNSFTSFSIILPLDLNISSSVTSSCVAYSGIQMSTCIYSSYNLTFIGNGYGKISVNWGYITLPNSFAPTSSFNITSYNNGFITQQTTGYIGLTMNTVNQFSTYSLSISSTVNNALANLSLNLTMPIGAPSGTLTIFLPSQIVINSGFTCNLNNIVITCNQVGQSITLSLSDSILSNQIMIYNLQTPYSEKPTSIINISLANANNYSSLFSKCSSITNLSPSSLTNPTVSTNTGFLNQSTPLTFTATLIGKQSYVIITLSAQFPSLSSAPSSLVTLTSSTSIRYNTTATSLSLTLNLITASTSTSSPFLIQTFTSDGYIIQNGTTNSWIPKCSTTNCRDCDGTTCLNCYNSNLTSYTILYNNISCISACASGNYLVNTSCNTCNSNCLQCVNNATTCISCNTNTYLYNSACSATCPIGYYQDKINLICVNCVNPCKTCTDQYTCLSCNSSTYLSGTNCLATCPTGLYIQNNSSQTCDACNSICLTCANYTFACTSCNTSLNLALQNSNCVTNCSINYFPVNGVCTKCMSPCLTCNNSTTNCSSCNLTSNYPVYFNYQCLDSKSCPTGYYVDSVTLYCVICNSICLACYSYSNCSSCQINYYLYNSSTCLSQCPNTTYLVDSTSTTCTVCINNCTTCQSATQCTSCPYNLYLYKGVCYSTCPSLTFISGINCVSCTNGCGNCTNSTYCLSCSLGYYFYNSACSLTCIVGTYINNLNCTICPTGCSNCNNNSYCTSCSSGYSLQNLSTCVVNCSKGISINQICYPCGQFCLVCESACTKCQSGYNLYQGYCSIDCPVTTVAINQVCSNCSIKYLDCSTCNSTQCLTCIVGALQNGVCANCSIGTYVSLNQCLNCPILCQVCVNNTYCTSCKNPNYISNNFCYSSCPVNQIPSGNTCVDCVPHCSKCNKQTTLCSICTPSYYIHEGGCVKTCPTNLTLSLNNSNCVTISQYYKEYSEAAKIIYFPFTISSFVIILITIIFQFKYHSMHFVTFLVSVFGFMELGIWILFLIIQILNYKNGHPTALYGFICLIIGIGFLYILNIMNVIFYNNYIKYENQFKKWIKKGDNYCATILILVTSTIFNFKFFRILYSRLFGKGIFQMVLTSTNQLKPINFLSLVSVLLCSFPGIIAGGLGLYYSIAQDQEFFLGFDCLLMSIFSAFLTLIDLHHPKDYFHDQFEANNVQNVYKLQSDSNSQVKADFNQQQHIEINNPNAGTTFYKSIGTRKLDMDLNHSEDQIQRNANKTYDEQNSRKQFIEQNSEQNNEEYNPKDYWVSKRIDKYGYIIKTNKQGVEQRFDNQGYRVVIENGIHKKYDDEGYRVQKQVNGTIKRYDQNDFQVIKNGDQIKKYDNRNYQVKQQNGKFKFYNDEGFQVRLDSEGNEILYDQEGDRVVFNKETNQYDKYDQLNYLIKKNEKGDRIRYDQDGFRVQIDQKNKITKYDDQGYKIIKDQHGKITRFDQFGFRVQKDQFGNVLRFDQNDYLVKLGWNNQFIKYDSQGNRVQIDPKTGKITKFDQDGYQMREQNGKIIKYDKNGFRAEKNYYGTVTLYDQKGYIVQIDQNGNVNKFNQQGLRVNIKQNGQIQYFDKRGRKVVTDQQGNFRKFDNEGNQIWLDEQGYEIQRDQIGNVLKYDKIGNKVQQEDIFGFQQEIQQGEQAIPPKKQKKINKRKQIDHDLELNNLMNDEIKKLENSNIQFSQISLDQLPSIRIQEIKEIRMQQDLKQMIDDQYNVLEQQEPDVIKLAQLKEVQILPHEILKENRSVKSLKKQEQVLKLEETIIPDVQNLQLQEQNILPQVQQPKSIRDVQLSQKTQENEGVQLAPQHQFRFEKPEESYELDRNMVIDLSKLKNQINDNTSRTSNELFQQSPLIQTKTQYNKKLAGYDKEDQLHVMSQYKFNPNNINQIKLSNDSRATSQKNIIDQQKKEVKLKKRKVYDPQQQIQSVGNNIEWEAQEGSNLFFNINQNNKIQKPREQVQKKPFIDFIQEEVDNKDTLSDFIQEEIIKQSSFRDMKKKIPIYTNRQSDTLNYRNIQLQQEKLFKTMEQKKPRVISHTPNPLITYAQKIENEKNQELKMKSLEKIYLQNSTQQKDMKRKNYK